MENRLKATPLYIRGLIFSVGTAATQLGYGVQEAVKSVAPGETDTLVFTATIDNSKIPKLWCEHVRNRENRYGNQGMA